MNLLLKNPCYVCHYWQCVFRRYKKTGHTLEATCKAVVEAKFGKGEA